MFNISDILAEWKKDSIIKENDLSAESLKCPVLHQKYYEMYILQKQEFRKLEFNYKKLLKIKLEFYTGKLSDEELKEYGWQPFHLKILKENLSYYMNADKDLQKLGQMLEDEEDKLETLKTIIDSINKRGFVIKNSIDYIKFSTGF